MTGPASLQRSAAGSIALEEVIGLAALGRLEVLRLLNQ